MDEFSALAALGIGAALTIHAYKQEILASADRVDAKLFDILKALKPYVYRKKHGGKKKARHRFQRSEKFYTYDKSGKKVIWA